MRKSGFKRIGFVVPFAQPVKVLNNIEDAKVSEKLPTPVQNNSKDCLFPLNNENESNCSIYSEKDAEKLPITVDSTSACDEPESKLDLSAAVEKVEYADSSQKVNFNFPVRANPSIIAENSPKAEISSTNSSCAEPESKSLLSVVEDAVEKVTLSQKRTFNCPIRNELEFVNASKRQKLPLSQYCSPKVSPPENDLNKSLTSEEIYDLNKPHNVNEIARTKRYFNVLWCKKSSKQRKIWEGDAILIVESRSAVLKDLDGAKIANGFGYKAKEIAQLDEGSRFCVGGKECEIQNQISEAEYLSGKCFQSSENQIKSGQIVPLQRKCIFKKFQSPFAVPPPPKKIVDVISHIERPPRDPNYLYMPDPSVEHQEKHNEKKLPVTDVKVDQHIGQHLRPHQVEGLMFMYECIQGFRNFQGYGAILGDEMGLGKTLQCIALVWTLMKQGPYGRCPILKRILIVTPSSLVKNWEAEFFKWLGRERIAVFAVGPKKKVEDFIHSCYSILIISYEMYVRSANTLSAVRFDLVICDEGHRLKNVNIKTSEVIMKIPTKRRILLSGTPIQNDLEEFYSIVEFTNPGILGSISSFRRVYQVPIVKSQNPYCSNDDKKLGSSRAAELSNKIKLFFLRRTQDVINKYLPPKYEAVVFVEPSAFQCSLYRHLLQSKNLQTSLLQDGMRGCGGVVHLQYISALRKLCNHPFLLHSRNTVQKSSTANTTATNTTATAIATTTTTASAITTASSADGDTAHCDNSIIEHMRSAFPEDCVYQIEQSGKMKVLNNLLLSLFSDQVNEKIVLVSNFTQTLDLIENLCKACSYYYLRLDGSTSSVTRLDLVEKFNASYTKFRIFLLSSKAGGVGLNLIGASRIVLYDIDWNPATDLQAMARVWRDGQKRPVYVYRFLTAGTIEEKIYQRQVTKQGLSGTVIDTTFAFKSQFSYEDLKDIFRFHSGAKCVTHDSLQCDCLEFDDTSIEAELDKENVMSSVNKSPKVTNPQKKTNTSMAELFKWKHIPAPISAHQLPKSHLEACTEDITFLFTNCVNIDKTS